MQVSRIDPADPTAFDAWFAVRDAAQRHDQPSGPFWTSTEQRALATDPSPANRRLHWVAAVDGCCLGAAQLELPQQDNLHLGNAKVDVHPDFRRRGVGTLLLAAVEEAARGGGRRSLVIPVEEPYDRAAPPPPGVRFLERHGFTRRLDDVRRDLSLPGDDERLTALREEAAHRSQGYRLTGWRDRVPADLVDERARLGSRLVADAPTGELDVEPERWDAARVRAQEDAILAMGRNLWGMGALAPDGTLAGYTEIAASVDDPGWAFQWDTLVDPAHRGRRLGMLLKVANLRAFTTERPAAHHLVTWNAESNAHMVAINDALGFVPVGTPGRVPARQLSSRHRATAAGGGGPWRFRLGAGSPG